MLSTVSVSRELLESSSPRLLLAALTLLLADVVGRFSFSSADLAICAYGCSSAGRTLSYACVVERTRAYGELSSGWLVELCCDRFICFVAPKLAVGGGKIG